MIRAITDFTIVNVTVTLISHKVMFPVQIKRVAASHSCSCSSQKQQSLGAQERMSMNALLSCIMQLNFPATKFQGLRTNDWRSIIGR